MKFTYTVKVGFWDVKEGKERSEIFHIKKAPTKQTAEKKALTQAMTKFGKLVEGVDPFFVEQTLEIYKGKAIVFEYESSIDVGIPGGYGHGVMVKALEAVNLHKLGRSLTMEDNEITLGQKRWSDLQETHRSMHRSQYIPILVKVTEDGRLLVSIREENEE